MLHGVYVDIQRLSPTQHQDEAWLAFKSTWNNLAIDTYMKDQGTYRRRSYSTMKYSYQDNIAYQKPYMPLFKSSDYNHFAGDLYRHYSETDKTLFSNIYFSKALSLAINIANACEKEKRNLTPRWFIEIDQYRIEAIGDTQGKPTPEGIHSDGTSYFLLMLVERKNIHGGRSHIYDEKMNNVCSITLTEPGDIMLINDAKMFHEVSQISSTHGYGHRDILHISLTNLNSNHAIKRRFGINESDYQRLIAPRSKTWI